MHKRETLLVKWKDQPWRIAWQRSMSQEEAESACNELMDVCEALRNIVGVEKVIRIPEFVGDISAYREVWDHTVPLPSGFGIAPMVSMRLMALEQVRDVYGLDPLAAV